MKSHADDIFFMFLLQNMENELNIASITIFRRLAESEVVFVSLLCFTCILTLVPSNNIHNWIKHL